VNCRVGPSTSSTVITALAEGARVQLTGPASGGWQPVLCANRQGYISASYLSAVQNTPTPAGAQAAQAVLAPPTLDATVTPAATATTSEAVSTTETPDASTTPAPMTPTEIVTVEATPAPTEQADEAPPVEPTATMIVEPTLAPTEEVTSSAWVVGTGTGLACLTAPSWESDLVIGIPDGTELLRYGDPVDGWQAVLCGETRGYVDASNLASTPPTPEPTPVVVESPTVEVVATEEIATDPTAEVIETEVIATEDVLSNPVDVAPETFTLAPVAETSILRTMPDAPQGGVVGGGLTLGGPDGGVVALTFDASGYADGTIIEATLLITGTGENAGAGGTILALPGVWIDPSSTTIATVYGLGGGSIGWLDVAPGVQTAVDVTGVVSGGTITFVITGTESPVTIASSSSGSGPLLVITVQAP